MSIVDFAKAARESHDYMDRSTVCPDCGHHFVAHNFHCCEFCKVCESLSVSSSDEYPCARASDNRNG